MNFLKTPENVYTSLLSTGFHLVILAEGCSDFTYDINRASVRVEDRAPSFMPGVVNETVR